MSNEIPWDALKPLVTDKFIEKREKKKNTKRYVPYSFTQGLRKTMDHLSANDIQEVTASRSFNTDKSEISGVSSSSVSDIIDGKVVKKKQIELDFDRSDSGKFPWLDVQSILGQPSTVYDLPVRHLVVKFNNENFKTMWEKTIEDAIDMNDPPTSWIEPPFYAVLESSPPGEADARKRVRETHEEFYFKPMFRSEENYEGMDWTIRTLDLESIWSYQGFADTANPIHTVRKGGRQYKWTPRRIEKYLMNYFDSSEDYTGAIRSSGLANCWRGTYSSNLTSIKVFEWEEDEEWVQTEA